MGEDAIKKLCENMPFCIIIFLTTSNEYDNFFNALFPLVYRINVYNLILYTNTF